MASVVSDLSVNRLTLGPITERAPPTGFREALDQLYEGLLDDAYRRLSAPNPDEAACCAVLDELFGALRTRRLGADPEEWRQVVKMCRRHPLLGILHHDPFTARAYNKPRGYAGDAVMMDYIYGREEFWPPPECSPLGRKIFDFTTTAPASEGVRARRGYVAHLIDRTAEEMRRPHVLSVAAGHFREAALAASVKRRRLGRCVALDGDADSLKEVERCYSRYNVEPALFRVRQLLAGKAALGKFDLIYSLGLFDYLTQPVGQRLVNVLFQMLRPAGRLVVANFLPGIRDVGYMESFMDWLLIYRNRQDMMDLTVEIPQCELREVALFAEENQNILFLDVRRN
jgi:extracellular factor (EF) 3-hydroxypalmitic acid methyl ester biosynthesis protein